MDEMEEAAEHLLATADQYQQYYEQLKEQHVSVRDDYALLETEYVELLEESKLVKDKYVTMLNMAQADNQQLKKECSKAQKMALTPKQVEMIRLDTREELRTEYQRRIDALEDENKELCHQVTANEQKYLKNENELQKKLQEKCSFAEFLEQKMKTLEEEHSLTVKQLVSTPEHESLEIDLIKARQENAQLTVVTRELRSELNDRNSQINEITLEHTKKQNKLKNSEIELKNKNNELSIKIESLSRQNQRLCYKFEEQKKRGSRREEDFTSLKDEMEKFQGQIEEMKSLAVSGVRNMHEGMRTSLASEEHKNKKLDMFLAELKCKLEVSDRRASLLKKELAKKDASLSLQVESLQRKAAKSEALHHRHRINAEKTCNELKVRLQEEADSHEKTCENLRHKYEELASSQNEELSGKLNEAHFKLKKLEGEMFLSHKSEQESCALKESFQEVVEQNTQLLASNSKLEENIKCLEQDLHVEKKKINSKNKRNRDPYVDRGDTRAKQVFARINHKLERMDHSTGRWGTVDKGTIEQLKNRISDFENKLYHQQMCLRNLNLTSP